MPDMGPRLAVVGLGQQQEGLEWAASMSMEPAQGDHRIRTGRSQERAEDELGERLRTTGGNGAVRSSGLLCPSVSVTLPSPGNMSARL